MPADQPETTMRVGALLRRPVCDREGRIIGRVADFETTRDGDGRERVTALIVTAGRWGRLLGYERHEAGGPWLLERLARIVLRRHITRVPWPDVHLQHQAPPPETRPPVPGARAHPATRTSSGR